MQIQAYRRSVAFDAMQAVAAGETGGRYGADRQGPSWGGLLLIAALHGAALWALVAMDLVHIVRKPVPPTVVTLLAEALPPPPPAAPEPAPETPSPVQVVSPPPVVQVPVTTPPPVRTVAVPPPAAPVAVAAPVAAAGPPVQSQSVVPPDFAGDQLGNPAPRYPTLSRKLREQGTAVIRVTVSAGGQPGDCRVQRSSGHDRLDAAALATVCRWKFNPATRGGVAVDWPMDVPIPFVLRG